VRGDCSIRIGGLGFTTEQIAAAATARSLLSIELDLSNAKHCQCEACTLQPRDVMSFDEICGVIDQAAALGARRCILVDSAGESHYRLAELIAEIGHRGLEIELFTTGTIINAEMATLLRRHNVSIVIEAELPTRSAAIDALRAQGYGSPGAPRLAARVAINSETFHSLPNWWREMRSAGIEPYVQIMTPQSAYDAALRNVPSGSDPVFLPLPVLGERVGVRVLDPIEADSKNQNHPHPSPLPEYRERGQEGSEIAAHQLRELFESLHRIDHEEFSRPWENPPELTGRSCKRHLFACHATPCGTIFACVGVTIPLGNVRDESLRIILDESEVLENLRAFDQKVKEPCRTCSKTVNCYGCRGSAYQLTGDYLAGDQLCWKAEGIQIPSLPAAVGTTIPHGPAIRFVDWILSVGERAACTEFVVRADSLFVDSDGRLDETAYIEMIAQSFAASHGFHLSADEQAMHRGMLLGVKDMVIHGTARVGDRLLIDVRKITRFGDFGVVEGTVSRDDGMILASAEIKVWRPSGEAEKAMFP
jgi:radical SAM protein with 4Fe4S-binding SPASM domain